MKPAIFLGDSKDVIRQFPQEAREDAGYQIERVQRGVEPKDWKPLKAVGRGVREIRVSKMSGEFRIVYVAFLADAIYVLHAFQKKTQETAKRDIDLAAIRS
jgi:phage-related protein